MGVKIGPQFKESIALNNIFREENLKILTEKR
jgi:hypothetical protein